MECYKLSYPLRTGAVVGLELGDSDREDDSEKAKTEADLNISKELDKKYTVHRTLILQSLIQRVMKVGGHSQERSQRKIQVHLNRNL